MVSQLRTAWIFFLSVAAAVIAGLMTATLGASSAVAAGAALVVATLLFLILAQSKE
jgi:hypothetical protein